MVLCAALGASAQDPSGNAGLWAEATLYRDEWGVPHVYAQTPRGLGFAFGYAQAEDHAEQMLLAYRAVTGRLAEVQGESAAAADAFALRMGHGQLAERALSQLDDATRTLCEGFAQGVNAWLEANIDRVPEWAEGVSPQDVLALWHAFVTLQSPLDLPVQRPMGRGMETGNAWAVAPGHTPEGQTVLVINPHQFHNGPFIWTEAHLVLGDYNVYGATLYGLPVMVMGHNPVLGWGFTPNLADTADVFERNMQAARSSAAELDLPDMAADQALLLEYYSKARPYYVRTDTGMEERLEPVHLTAGGPLIESNGQLYLWRIAGYGQFGGLRQLVDMGRAQSLADFQSVVLQQQLPPCNLIYGDALGNIFYLYNAVTGYRQFPEEAQVRTRNMSEGQLAWKEPLPPFMLSWGWDYELGPADMPFVVNPESGFVEASGGSPWTASDLLPYTSDLWPTWLMGDTDSYRASRVRQLLRSGMRSFRDNQSMLYDLVAPAAPDMKGALLAAAESQPDWVAQAHPDLRGFLEVLANWDNLADVKTPGMTAYHLWWTMLRARMPLYTSDAMVQQAMLAGDAGVLQEALAAAAEAARMMRNEFDRIDLPWGEAHKVKRGEREEQLPGALSGEPIFASGDFTYAKGEWVADYGYGFAMAVQFGQTPQAVSVVPFGASDVKGSPHYDDQLDLLLTRRLKRTRYQDTEVMRNATLARGCAVTLYPSGVDAAFRFTCVEPLTAALKTQAEAPGFLPLGQSAFSLFVQPKAERPAGAEVQLEISFYVPPEFCRDEDLEQLSLQRYASPGGWAPVPEPQWDYDRRTVFATGNVEGVYALLGPTQVFANAAPVPEGMVEAEGEAPPIEAATTPENTVLQPPTPQAAKPAPTSAPLADPSVLLPPQIDAKGTFKFEWANPPQPIGDIPGEASFQQPSGERQFKFERHNAPDAPTSPDTEPTPEQPEATEQSPASVMSPAAPETSESTGAPTGSRQFKFRRGGGETSTAPPAESKKGRVTYGLPPHVLEQQQKQMEQQERGEQ